MTDRYNLTDAWVLQVASGPDSVPAEIRPALQAGVPASVPGCVHTDLLAAGLIADPYLDR